MANWDKPTEADGQDNDFTVLICKNLSLHNGTQKRNRDKNNDKILPD